MIPKRLDEGIQHIFSWLNKVHPRISGGQGRYLQATTLFEQASRKEQRKDVSHLYSSSNVYKRLKSKQYLLGQSSTPVVGNTFFLQVMKSKLSKPFFYFSSDRSQIKTFLFFVWNNTASQSLTPKRNEIEMIGPSGRPQKTNLICWTD